MEVKRNWNALGWATFGIAVLALIGMFTVPEVRKFVGLDKGDEPSHETVESAPPADADSAESAADDSDNPAESTESTDSGAREPGSGGLFLKDVECVRRHGSVQVFAEVLQLGDYDGRLVYKIIAKNGDVWDADDIFSETTEASRNLEVTDVNYRLPVKCIVELEAERPTYHQSHEAMSN